MPGTEFDLTEEQILTSMKEESKKADAIIDGLIEQPAGVFKTTSFVEPFTWAWVAITLAEGALARVGGQVFAKLFGGGEKPDIAKLVNEILKAMSQIVRHALDERDLRVLETQLQQIQMDLLAYLDAPRGRDRLDFATNNSSSAMFQIKSLDLLGHGAFMVAVGVHIAVLQERVRAIDRRDRKTITRVLQDVAIPHAEEMHTAWRTWHEGRYKIQSRSISLPVGSGHSFHYWILYRDSKEIRRGFYAGRPQFERDSQATLVEDRERVWTDVVYARYVEPSEKIVERWRQLLARE